MSGAVGVEPGHRHELAAVHLGIGLLPVGGDVRPVGDARRIVEDDRPRGRAARRAGGEKRVLVGRLGARDHQQRHEADRDHGGGRALHACFLPPLRHAAGGGAASTPAPVAACPGAGAGPGLSPTPPARLASCAVEDLTTTSEVPIPPGYPAEWDADVVLSDGRTVRIRPIRPDDGPRIVDFHGRQSPESIYFRYFAPPRAEGGRGHPSPRRLRRPHGVRGAARRPDDRRGPLRPLAAAVRGRSGLLRRRRPPGQGLATVLLEYLAVAARRAGISAFTATVLPTNQRMVGVFRAAGFQVRSTFDEGVIEVHLDLQPTPDAEAAIEARAQRAEAEAVRLLLAPRSVAVIGAGRERHGVGHAVLRNLLDPRRQRRGVPRQPAGRPRVRRPPCRRSATSRARSTWPWSWCPRPRCPRWWRTAAARASRRSSSSPPGSPSRGPRALRSRPPPCGGPALRHAAARAQLPGRHQHRPRRAVARHLRHPQPRPGPVALLSESGTIGGALLDRIGDAGRASSFAAIGNRADVSANDMLRYWADDDRTRLVLLYLESFGNARKFSRIARALSRTPTIVAVRSGERPSPTPTRRGADTRHPARPGRADRHHPGRHAVPAARRGPGAGVPAAAAGDRVALVGNGGGSLALAADACVDAGLVLAHLGPGVSDAVRAPAAAAPAGQHRRPGLRGGRRRSGPGPRGGPGRRRRRQRAGGVRTGTPAADGRPGGSRGDRPGAGAGQDAPGLRVRSPSHHHSPDRADDVPVFDFPDDAAYALGRVTRYAQWREAPEGEVVPADLAPDEVRRCLAGVLGEGRTGQMPTAVALGRSAPLACPWWARAVGGRRGRGRRRRRAGLPGGGQGRRPHPPGQDRGRRPGPRRARRE